MAGFISRFFAAWQAAAAGNSIPVPMPESPGCAPAISTSGIFDDLPKVSWTFNGDTPEMRDLSAAHGLSGASGRYLAERADAELSAREFAERFGSGY